jgi:hypothetical protein
MVKPRRKLDKNWQVSLISSNDELHRRLAKAIKGSDYDWNEWFRRAFSEREQAKIDISAYAAPQERVRKTHICDCIKELEKEALPAANQIYALLCDMVHPNYGLNTLVLETGIELDRIHFEYFLSSNPQSSEASAWFFELISGSMANLFRLERDLIERSQSMLRFYQVKAHWLTRHPILAPSN